jgi:outer membrane murein-binding lipoprotein Lpp
MKKFSLALVVVAVLTTAGCSKTDKPETSVKPQSTPDAERLKSDSERLQQATNNAAKEREKAAAQTASPSRSQP